MVKWQTQRVPAGYDLLAPDGSEIRRLVQVDGGSMVYCTLPPGQVTRAVKHRTVEELWFCVAGAGEVWRQDVATLRAEIVPLTAGVAITIPVGTAFQLRQMGARPLELVITTLPPWPGPDEALPIAGAWEARPA